MTVVENSESVNNPRSVRWSRNEISHNLRRYFDLKVQGNSQREIAKKINLPRTTLQSWLSYRASLDENPVVIDFFEREAGLAILHRLTAALHIVFTSCGACGVGLISKFFEMTHLDRFIASSEESQRKINVKIEQAVVKYAEEETARLAKNMPKKEITVAQDETFTGGLCLVAIEPVSNFILLEKESEKRDCHSWDLNMKEALKDLPVKIVQSTSDEGTGILSYVKKNLGAHHSPDIFHIQQSLSRAVSAGISSKLRSAEKVEEEALDSLNMIKEKFQQQSEGINQGPGRPIDYEKNIRILKSILLEKIEEKERINEIQKELRNKVKGIGDFYHPINLETGVRYSSGIIISLILENISRIREIAIAEGLSDSSLALIDKAEKVVPKLSSTIDFVSTYIRQSIEKLDMTFSQKVAINEYLIPSLYLERISKKVKKEESIKMKKLANELKEKAYHTNGKLSGLDDHKKEQIENECRKLVQIFQRSSSCVEGRNGVLSFRHHELHKISQRKRVRPCNNVKFDILVVFYFMQQWVAHNGLSYSKTGTIFPLCKKEF
jgi:hypothetical protein